MGGHQAGALGLCRDSAHKMDMDLFSRSADLVDSFDLLCSVSGYDVSSLCVPPGLLYRDLSQPSLPDMGVLEVTGVRFDVASVCLLYVGDLVQSSSSLMLLDDTRDGDWFPLTTAVRSRGGGSRYHRPSVHRRAQPIRRGGVYQDCVHSAGIS